MIINTLSVISYLEKITGELPDLQSIPMEQVHGLSLHLRKSFQLYQLRFLSKELVLLLHSGARDPMSPTQAIKILHVFRNKLEREVVLVFDKLPAYLRSRYIAKKIPFMVPGLQLFIPQMLLDLNDIRETKQVERSYFRPATQCMILYHLLIENISGLSQAVIAERLGYSTMTISRAITECEDKGIVVKNSGVEFKYESKQLWLQAKGYMQSPVNKIVFTEKLTNLNNNLKSGMTAMCHYTDLAADDKVTIALSLDQYKQLLKESIEFDDGYGKLKLEVWNYDPTILSSNKYVDQLSLFLIINDEDIDARTTKALDKLVDQFYD